VPPVSPTIRPLRAGEAGALLGLWAAADATPSVTDSVEEIDRARGHDRLACLVAEADGAIIGSIFASFDGWRGNMYRLAVHPGHRRRGVARRLVAAAEEVLGAWGVRRITALVEKDHPAAVAFWGAAGYADDARMARFVRTLSRAEARG
jgi:ribosomal protein S18 acetylase RimI-like enzyme